MSKQSFSLNFRMQPTLLCQLFLSAPKTPLLDRWQGLTWLSAVFDLHSWQAQSIKLGGRQPKGVMEVSRAAEEWGKNK